MDLDALASEGLFEQSADIDVSSAMFFGTSTIWEQQELSDLSAVSQLLETNLWDCEPAAFGEALSKLLEPPGNPEECLGLSRESTALSGGKHNFGLDFAGHHSASPLASEEGSCARALNKPSKSKKRRRGAVKTAPSRFCHVCFRKTRPTTETELFACSSYTNATRACRKVECDRCILKQAQMTDAPAHEQATLLERARKGERLCLHCQGQCPPKAQCKFYSRTNEKKKQRRLLSTENSCKSAK